MPAGPVRILAALVVLAASAVGGDAARLVTQTAHDGRLECAAFSPDGRRVATGARDGTVVVWDLETGRVLRRLAAHDRAIACVAFTPDGTEIVTGAEDAQARRFRLSDGREMMRYRGHEPHVEIKTTRTSAWPERGMVLDVAVSPDGRRVLTAANDETARLWDLVTGDEIRAYPGHRARVYVGRFVDGGRRVLTAGQDGTSRLFDAETARELRRFAIRREEGLARYVVSATLTPDGERLVTGSQDGVLRVWEVETGREMYRMIGDDAAMTSLHIPADGDSVLAAAEDGTIRRFDLLAGEVVAAWSGSPPLAFSGDGSKVVLAPPGGGIEVRTAANGQAVSRGLTRAVRLEDVGFTVDGGAMLLALGDGTAAIRTLASGDEKRIVGSTSEASTAVAAIEGEDGTWLVVGAEDGMLRFERPARDDRAGGVGRIVALATAPGRRMLVSGCADGSAWAWDLTKAERMQRYRLREGRLADLAISPDEARMAVAVGRHVEIFDLALGASAAEADGHFDQVNCVTFAAGGRWVLSGGADGTVRLWKARDGDPVRRYDGNLEDVVGVAMTPDSRKVVAASIDGYVHVWNAATTKRVGRLRSPFPSLRALALTPAGTHVVLLGDGPEAAVLSLAEERETGRIVRAEAGAWVVVDPDGRYDCRENRATAACHWRVGSRVVLLSQLAARYRTPRLLRHVLGLAEDALPPVEPLAELPPPPDVRLERIPGVSGRIRVRVSDRGGGIGRVVYRSEGPFEVLLEPLRPVPGEPGVFAGEIATGSPAGATTFEVRAFGLGDHVRSRTRFITIDER